MADRDADDALRAVEQGLEHAFTEADLTELGNMAVAIILERTKRGIDASGVPFMRYSDDYRKRKIKAGHGGNVNLAWTGAMLGSLAVVPVVQDQAVDVGPLTEGERRKTLWNQGGTRNAMGRPMAPAREFLDLKMGAELQAVADVTGKQLALRVERRFSGDAENE